MTKERILSVFKDINQMYNNAMMYDNLSKMIDELVEDSKKSVEPVSEKEKINQLKYMTETFGCKNKDVEKGFVGGLFYAVTLIEHGKEYADSKVDWDYIGREDEEYVVPEEKETGCSSC